MSWFKIERETWQSEVFKEEPFSEREAWFWLIGAACFKETKINILNNPIILERGQLSHSMRFLSEKFKWSLGKTQNFINKLKKWKNISVKTNTGQQIITICNYSIYQDREDNSNTLQIQDKYTSNTKNKNDKELKNDNITPISPLPENSSNPDKEKIEEDFENLWIEYKPFDMSKGSKAEAKKKYLKLRKEEKVDHGTIIGKCREYITGCHRLECRTKHLTTWLNQRGWEDSYPDGSTSPKLSPNQSRHEDDRFRTRVNETAAYIDDLLGDC